MTVAFNSDVDLTLEIGFASNPKDSSITWTDVSDYFRAFSITRGRTHVMDTVQAGTLQVVLDNSDRRFDPTNTSSPYDPNVLPAKPIRIQATHNLTTYNLFRGTIDGWPLLWPQGKDAIVQLEATDDFKMIALDTLVSTEVQEKSGTRIGNILDDVSWPAGRRSLDTGAMDVVGTTVECVNPLNEIQTVVESEVGLFFMAGNGDATFQDQNHRGAQVVQDTFSDDGANLPYADVSVGYDDTQIWNSITATRVGVTATVASEDATSVTAYGRRKLRLNDLLLVNSTDLQTIADLYRDTFKDPALRIEQLVFYPQEDPSNLWPVALGAEISDKYNVEITPPGSGTPTQIDQDVFVEQITHTVTADPQTWTVTWHTSNA